MSALIFTVSFIREIKIKSKRISEMEMLQNEPVLCGGHVFLILKFVKTAAALAVIVVVVVVVMVMVVVGGWWH